MCSVFPLFSFDSTLHNRWKKQLLVQSCSPYPRHTCTARVMVLGVCVCVCLSVCLSVCLPACLPACLSVCLSVCLPAWLPACLLCLHTCLPACLRACLPSARLSVHCLFVCLWLCYHYSATIRNMGRNMGTKEASVLRACTNVSMYFKSVFTWSYCVQRKTKEKAIYLLIFCLAHARWCIRIKLHGGEAASPV